MNDINLFGLERALPGPSRRAAHGGQSGTRALLTSREFDVLQLMAAGESNKAIARRLGIEIYTVKSHMNAILSKLNATSPRQAAAIATTQ